MHRGQALTELMDVEIFSMRMNLVVYPSSKVLCCDFRWDIIEASLSKNGFTSCRDFTTGGCHGGTIS